MPIAQYAGNPGNFPSSIPVPSTGGGTAPSFTVLMAPVTANRDSIVNLASSVEAMRARNWQPQVAWPGGTVGPYTLKWDDFGQQWILTGFSPGGSPVVDPFGYDGQGNLVETYPTWGSQEPPSACVADGTGGLWIASPGGVTNVVSVAHLPFGAGSWTSVGNVTPANPTDGQIAVVGTKVIGAFGSSTAGNATLFQLSPAFTPGVISLTASKWILKSNGSLAIALPMVAGGGSARSSADGLTWTAVSMAGQIGSTDVPIDIAWNTHTASWAMAVAVGGGATCAWYTSPDGLHWTATGATTASIKVNSLSAVGQSWVAIGTQAGNNGICIFSLDATLWYPTAGLIAASVANSPIVRASPTQLGIVAALLPTNTTTPAAYRFGLDVGLPDQVVT